MADEFSFSSTSKKNEFSTHLFSHLLHLFFSIFSHPLYFSYFIFFSPYLLRVLSFLFPLFITTTVLLAALLTVTSPDLVEENDDSEFSKSKWGFLLFVYRSYIKWLKSKTSDKDEEIGYLDEFEAYLVMFQQSIFDVLEPKSEEDCSEGLEAPDVECSGEGREDFGPVEEPRVNSDENSFEKVDKVEATRPIAEVKSLETLFQETTELEYMSCQEEDKGVKPRDPELCKVEESKEKLPLRSGSKVMGTYSGKVSTYSGGENAAAVKVRSLGSPESNWEYSGKVLGYNQALCSNLGSFGSVRREKEWRRTLACKLFEERHNVNGSEGMDMLWETYETDSIKVQQKSNTRKENKGAVGYGEEDQEEEDTIEGKLCCLEALKFSAGKMNLGMGRPNFLKISKALKGIGWLHHASRHGRKGKR